MSLMSHLRVAARAWRAESRERARGRRRWSDAEFLPAALEIAERPPSPVGRLIVWTIMATAVAALLWSFLAHVDTVAVAEGRLVPEGRLRSVEAAEQGVIRSIEVREGQHVRAGQTLIELDPTIAEAEADTARSELSTASLTRARDGALLGFIMGRGAAFSPPPDAEPAAVEAERQLVAARIDEYRAKIESIAQREAGARASLDAARAEIGKIRRTLPLLREALDLQKGLEAQGFGARQKLLQQQQAYVSAEQDLEGQIAKAAEAGAQIASIRGEAAQTREEFISRAAQERAEAEGVVATRSNVVREADQKRGLQRLTAPVSGVVQEITVTNIGEVPEVGKPLVTIVPDGEPLVAEALLLNRDAGGVRAGMDAAIKLEAYPFTRYGVLHGRVERISPDATVDEQRGLVFPVRVRLLDRTLMVDGRPAVISPGMSVTAEIVTGRRRVIDFLWSPLQRSIAEAAREG